MDPVDLPLFWNRNGPTGLSLTLLDDDGITPVDLTGYSFAMQVRPYPGAPDPALVTLGMAEAGAPGFFLDNAAAGQFSLTPPLPSTLIALPLTFANGKILLSYDVLWIAPDGVPEIFIYGPLLLYAGVTVL